MERQWLDEDRRTITDFLDYGRETVHRYVDLLAHEASRVQEIVIAREERFGVALWLRVLNEEDVPGIQFTHLDEHRFHQLSAYPPLLRHPSPRRILVLGGGDFPLAIRIMTCNGVASVEIADWDHRVGELVLEHCDWIRELYQAIVPQKRLIVPGEVDVRALLPNGKPESYDGIFADLIDAATLNAFIPGFLEYVYRMLRPGGFFSTQAGSGSLAPPDALKLAQGVREFRETFMGDDRKGSVWLWTWPIESFSYPQVWLCGWKERLVEPPMVTNRLIKNRFDLSRWKLDRPFFSPRVCHSAFAIPKDLAKAIGW